MMATMRFFTVVTVSIASLALASPVPLRGADNAAALATSIQGANVAVLRFDNSIQNIANADQASLSPSIQAGTQATAIVQQASSDTSQVGRVDIRSAASVQQAMTDFASSMNRVADDLVTRRNVINQAQQGGLFLDIFTTQANAGMDLMSTVMQDLPPRERNLAAQALATVPNGMSKVQAAFDVALTPGAVAANNGNQNTQSSPPADNNNNNQNAQSPAIPSTPSGTNTTSPAINNGAPGNSTSSPTLRLCYRNLLVHRI